MQPELERTTTTAITSSIRGLLLFLLVVCLFSVPVEISFAQDAGQTHVVRPGEYLSTIASRYGVSLSALIRANGISNPNLVRAGQVLIIPGGAPQATEAPPTSTPAPRSDATRPSSVPSAQYIPQIQSNPAPVASANDILHTVYPGESLSSIARKFGTTVSAIMARNGLPSSLIYSGQRLIIPAGIRPAAQDEVPTVTVEPSERTTGAPARTATPKPTATSTPTPTRIVPSMLLLPTVYATPTPARR
jgi:LysM repeat protein